MSMAKVLNVRTVVIPLLNIFEIPWLGKQEKDKTRYHFACPDRSPLVIFK